MKNKKAFTLVELLAVIIILAILIIIVAPNVVNLSGNTKVSLHDSKVKTLETAGEKYGNLNLNDYKDCKNDSGSSYLNNKCTVSIRDLVLEGFITADDDLNNIIDPETNEPMDGSVLLCYNPKEVNVYASYLKKAETPQCKDINVQTGASLALSSGEGIGYNGGNPIEVRILKTGKMTTSCTSSDPKVSCKIEGSTLKMTIEKDPSFTTGSRLAKIEVKGAHSAGTLTQTYNLTIYPTSIFIDKSQNDQLCMESGTTIEYPLEGNNMGTIDISSDKDILEGTIKENKSLILSAKDSTGIDTLTLKEGNGNAEVSISKNIFKLKLDKEMPTELLLGNKEQFTLDYGGNDSVRISVIPIEGDPAIKLYEKDENKLVDSLSLEGTSSTFNLKAVKAGKVKIVIEGSNCGRREYEIDVANLYVEKKEAILYFGGSVFETNIVGAKNDTFRCSSSDASAVKCEIKGSTLKLTPGTKETENATVQITGANGGFDTVNVKVRATSLSLVDKSGTPISKVCANIDTGSEQEININARNAGTITIDSISDNLLANATISNNKVTPVNRLLGDEDTFSSPYKQGYNTGITKIRIKESNGNKTASFDYYIYKLNTASNQLNFDVTNNTTEELNIVSSATGEITATSSHPEVASVSVVNPTYSYEINKENVSKLRITGHSIGETNIIIRGSDCGELIISVKVVGQKFSVTLRPGEFTTSIEGIKDGENSRELSCTTENSDNSCQVTFPDFTIGKNSDKKIGYTEKEDATKLILSDPKYSVGDTITLNESTNGKTYYAQSGDTIAPKCIFLENMSTVSYDEVEYFTLSCSETGSGSESVLTPSSFTISNPSVAEVVSVGDRTEIVDAEFGRAGYTYRVGIRGKSLVGEFDISLKPNVVVDKFGNGNPEHKKENVFSAEYKGYKRWYVGKNNDTDIVAILYVNIDMPEDIKGDDPDDTYTLILYGSGETKSYDIATVLTDIPWIREGYQEYITNVIVKEGITSIGDNIFQSLYNMTRVTLPESVKLIGQSSFNNDHSLKEINMPSSLETIKANAFENCKKLEKVTLNQGLISIEDNAFLNHGIRELFIPKTITNIGTKAFQSDEDNMKLEKLIFEQGIDIKTINLASFQNHKLKSLTIPRSVKMIAHNAFSQKSHEESSLADLIFETDSQLKFIYDRAFFNCPLSHLELPDSLEQIGTNVFYDLGDDLTEIRLGPNIESVGGAFAVGLSLQEFEVDQNNKSFTAHEGVLYTKDMTELVKYPDAYHRSHEDCTIPEGVNKIRKSAFGGIVTHFDKIEFTINMPSTLTNAESIENFVGTIFSEINVDPNNNYYKSLDGVLYTKDMKTALVLPTMYSQDEYEIQNGTTRIDTYFGYGNHTVKNITIPSSVTKIDNYAFFADPNLAFTNVYLNTTDNVETGMGSFSILQMVNASKYHRNIYVKSDNLKRMIESLYALEDISVERR